MRLYRRGPTWWVYYLARDGEKVRRSTKQTDRKRADHIAREWERRDADPTYTAAHEAALDDAVKTFLADRKQRGRADATIAFYATKAGHLVRLLPERLSAIDARAVDKYIATRTEEGAARHTVHKELVTLRGVLKVARRRGEFALDVAAVMPVAYSTGYKPRSRYLTEADAKRLLPSLPADVAAWVAFVLATGARLGEASRATVADLGAASIHVRGTKTATSTRDLPILSVTEWLIPYVRAGAPETGRLLPTWGRVRPIFWRWLEALKIGHLSPNDLRRSLGRWLRSHGVEPQLIGAMLGHADGRMSERVYGRMPVTSLGPVIESRFAVEPVHQAYTSEAKGADLGDVCVSAPPMILAFSVPGDGIEPPTRGFSIQQQIAKESGNMRKATCAVHATYTARLAKCGPLDPAGAFAALELAELTGAWGES